MVSPAAGLDVTTQQITAAHLHKVTTSRCLSCFPVISLAVLLPWQDHWLLSLPSLEAQLQNRSSLCGWNSHSQRSTALLTTLNTLLHEQFGPCLPVISKGLCPSLHDLTKRPVTLESPSRGRRAATLWDRLASGGRSFHMFEFHLGGNGL